MHCNSQFLGRAINLKGSSRSEGYLLDRSGTDPSPLPSYTRIPLAIKQFLPLEYFKHFHGTNSIMSLHFYWVLRLDLDAEIEVPILKPFREHILKMGRSVGQK